MSLNCAAGYTQPASNLLVRKTESGQRKDLNLTAGKVKNLKQRRAAGWAEQPVGQRFPRTLRAEHHDPLPFKLDRRLHQYATRCFVPRWSVKLPDRRDTRCDQRATSRPVVPQGTFRPNDAVSPQVSSSGG